MRKPPIWRFGHGGAYLYCFTNIISIIVFHSFRSIPIVSHRVSHRFLCWPRWLHILKIVPVHPPPPSPDPPLNCWEPHGSPTRTTWDFWGLPWPWAIWAMGLPPDGSINGWWLYPWIPRNHWKPHRNEQPHVIGWSGSLIFCDQANAKCPRELSPPRRAQIDMTPEWLTRNGLRPRG